MLVGVVYLGPLLYNRSKDCLLSLLPTEENTPKDSSDREEAETSEEGGPVTNKPETQKNPSTPLNNPDKEEVFEEAL